MKNRLVFTAFIIITSFILVWSNGNGNSIELGFANIEISIQGVTNEQIANIEMQATVTPIFAGFNEDMSYSLLKEGYKFSGAVPVERLEEIGGILFRSDSSSFGFPVVFRQTLPTKITLRVDSNLKPVAVKSANPEDPTMVEWQTTSKILKGFLMSPYEVVPDSLYTSWQKVIKFETDSLWPKTMDYALDGGQIPKKVQPWFENNLKCYFASYSILPYKPKAERFNNLTVDNPPIEACAFLDSIDYSATILKQHPICELRPFLYNILRFADGGLKKIEDTPIDIWQKEICSHLSKVITKPSQLLLDLLTAMSYIEQIEEDGIALTEKQLRNIDSYFNNNLSQIIISSNKLLIEAQSKTNLIDFTDGTFNLQSFIDKRFPNRPVIVDLWNSWCGPCRSVILQTEELYKIIDTKDLVVLYIVDTSTPSNQWRLLASDMAGLHLRINENDNSTIFQSFDLSGFPSYIFFDREHNVVHAQTAYPGDNDFTALMEQIISD